jgi:hypothetical protein
MIHLKVAPYYHNPGRHTPNPGDRFVFPEDFRDFSLAGPDLENADF